MKVPWISEEWRANVLHAVRSVIKAGEASPQFAVVCGLLDRVLTPQQMQVLDLLGKGKDNQEIADAMSLSAKTVSVHKHNLRRTLDLPHASAVVVLGVRYGDARRKGGGQ